MTGSYDGLVQGFSVDVLDPGSEVCKLSHACYMYIVHVYVAASLPLSIPCKPYS